MTSVAATSARKDVLALDSIRLLDFLHAVEHGERSVGQRNQVIALALLARLGPLPRAAPQSRVPIKFVPARADRLLLRLAPPRRAASIASRSGCAQTLQRGVAWPGALRDPASMRPVLSAHARSCAMN